MNYLRNFFTFSSYMFLEHFIPNHTHNVNNLLYFAVPLISLQYSAGVRWMIF